MNYKHWTFKPIEEVKEYYERTGLIVPTYWALTKHDFEIEIARFQNVVNCQASEHFKRMVTCDERKIILRRNQEYLHWLLTIQIELGL